MADENGSYDLDDDSSLEKFEEELVHEEKKKARSNFLLGILVLLVIGAIGFYGYTSIFAPKTPSPRKQAVKAVQPPPPAPAPAAEPEPMSAPEPVAPDAPVAPVAPTAAEPAPMAAPEPAAPLAEIKEEPLVVEIKVEEPAKPAETKQMGAVAMTPETKMETSAPEMTASVSDGKTYTLQVGFYKVPENAERISERLSDLNLRPRQIRRDFSVRMLKVYTGEFLYRETATKAAQELANQGFNPKVALTAPGRYELEMGSFDKEAQADSLVKELEDKQMKVRLDSGAAKMDATVVRLEDIDGTQRLEEIKEILKQENIDFFMIRR